MLSVLRLLPRVLTLLLCAHLSVAFLNCGNCSHGESLICPDYLNQQFEVQIKTYEDQPDSYILVQCGDTLTIDFSLLEGCSFPSVTSVKFNYCPFFNESFAEIFTKIGVHPPNVKHLSVYYAVGGISSLNSDHLIELTNLTFLNLEDTKLTNISEDAFQYTPNINTLHIRGNDLKSLPGSIFKNLRRLKILNLSSNNLVLIPEGLLDSLSSLESVYFWANKLESVPANLFSKAPLLQNVTFLTNQILSLDENLFLNNKQLLNVDFKRNKLSQVPSNLFVNNPLLDTAKFSSNKLKGIPEKIFLSNNLLAVVELENNLLTSLPEFMFKNLTVLRNLKLSKNRLSALPDKLFHDLKLLETVDLSSNLLKKLPGGLFNFTTKLQSVNVYNNSLTSLPENLFSKCQSLSVLDLSSNNLTDLSFNSFPSVGSFETVLKKIDISNNNLTSEGVIDKLVFALNNQVNLEDIDLSYNALVEIPPLYNFLKLRSVNFEGNQIKRLRLSTIFEVANNSIVNLRNNKIETIMNAKVFEAKIVKVYLSGNNLTCNCNNYNLVEEVQKEDSLALAGLSYDVGTSSPGIRPMGNTLATLKVIDREDLVCQRPINLYNRTLTSLKLIELECIMREDDCSVSCPCTYRPFDNMITVKCSERKLDIVPDFTVDMRYNYTLDLSGNSISFFNLSSDESIVNLTLYNNALSAESLQNGSVLPPNLRFLDLRKNNLTQLPDEFLSALNGTGSVVQLTHNPWICNCEIKHLHNFIQANYVKVKNIRDIICKENQKSLIDLTEEDICPLLHRPLVLMAIGIAAVLLVLIATLGTVTFYRYKTAIKVWLYTHRLCLWFVTEDELDIDKQYDAFISYSHKDEDFVNSVLIPGLENGDPMYKVCLHYRDWIVGEYIQNQIVNSVQNSRRTIVVLSMNFIESVWGQMEFRAAHQQALEDKTNRVIVIVYGEMPPIESLDEELRHYVSLHTYLKWGNPRFWESLRYAMPHPKHLLPSKKRKKNKIYNMELVNGHIKHDIHA